MTTTGDFADFVESTTYDDLSEPVVDGIKKRVLDSLGIAIGAIGAEPVEIVRDTVLELDGGSGACSIWGAAEAASPPEATMVNTALTRYLDFMDAILLPGEAPHPSDDVGAAVACGEYDDRSGAELIAGVGIAYEVHGELAAKAPGRDIGWDHVHVVFGATAAASKLLGLDHEQTRNAIGIAAAGYNPLRVTRTGDISMWKGVASANLARNGVYTAMLARNGMEGPVDAFEGQKGWKEIVQGGRDFQVEFTPCERVLDVMTKKYIAGTHAQTAIDALLALLDRDEVDPATIERIEVDTYESAKRVMGGGEGDRHHPETREQADHSLPYTLAAAALDGQLTREQYTEERIGRDDVRRLMRAVTVESDPELTARTDAGEQPCVVTVRTSDGSVHRIERSAYDGHPRTPMSWDRLAAKFHGLAADVYPESRRDEIVDVVRNLDAHGTRDLTALLGPP